MTKAIAPPGINSRLDPKRLAGDSDSLFPASNICVLPLNLCCCTGSGWTSLPEAFFCGEGRSSGGCESAEPGSAPGILSCTQHLNVPMILPQDQGVETGSTKAQPGGTPHGTAKAELRHGRPGNHLSSLCKDLLPPPAPIPCFRLTWGLFWGLSLRFAAVKHRRPFVTVTVTGVCDHRRWRAGGLSPSARRWSSIRGGFPCASAGWWAHRQPLPSRGQDLRAPCGPGRGGWQRAAPGRALTPDLAPH